MVFLCAYDLALFFFIIFLIIPYTMIYLSTHFLECNDHSSFLYGIIFQKNISFISTNCHFCFAWYRFHELFLIFNLNFSFIMHTCIYIVGFTFLVFVLYFPHTDFILYLFILILFFSCRVFFKDFNIILHYSILCNYFICVCVLMYYNFGRYSRFIYCIPPLEDEFGLVSIIERINVNLRM